MTAFVFAFACLVLGGEPVEKGSDQDVLAWSAEKRLEVISRGAAQPGLLIQLLEQSKELSDKELATLRQLDQELLSAQPLPDESVVLPLLRTLALSDNPRALGHVHDVFETYPERRHVAAVALADFALQRRRRPEEWRLLVRSLTVIEGAHARKVLQALLRFHERATKPRWIREVILIGLKLGDHGADDALALLQHWANGPSVKPHGPWKIRLAEWQKWFAKTHPEEPDPRLPADATTAKWKYRELVDLLYGAEGLRGDAQRGAAVFEKAQCHKCHRFAGRGESIGPDLTDLAGRFQRKELVTAILFPSEYVSDQFFNYNVLMRQGKTFVGVVGPGPGNSLAVLQANGEKVTVRKTDIERAVVNKQSAMPVGTLDMLEKREIADLFEYLLSRAPP